MATVADRISSGTHVSRTSLYRFNVLERSPGFYSARGAEMEMACVVRSGKKATGRCRGATTDCTSLAHVTARPVSCILQFETGPTITNSTNLTF